MWKNRRSIRASTKLAEACDTLRIFPHRENRTVIQDPLSQQGGVFPYFLGGFYHFFDATHIWSHELFGLRAFAATSPTKATDRILCVWNSSNLPNRQTTERGYQAPTRVTFCYLRLERSTELTPKARAEGSRTASRTFRRLLQFQS